MRNAPTGSPVDEHAWLQRQAAAACKRRWSGAWQVFLMLVLTLIVAAALALIVLLLLGKVRINLSLQSSAIVFVLLTAVGACISVVIYRLHTLRLDESAHLEAMSETQALEYVWALGLQTQDVATMNAMAAAGVALNRGAAMPSKLTNQHLEQARLEARQVPRTPTNALHPATVFFQEMLTKRTTRQ
jgi:hypothetical protein